MIKHICGISQQIQNRQVKKTYLALVRGVISENEATINMPIGRSMQDRKKMVVTKKGKEGIALLRPLYHVRSSKKKQCRFSLLFLS